MISPFHVQRKIASILGSVLHGCVSGSEHSPVGISFPFWQKHVDRDKATLGHIVRFTGSKADLIVLSRNQAIYDLEESNMISIGAIKDIPADAALVKFRRNRAYEKHLKHDPKKIKFHLPYLTMKSLSNKQQYKIYVEMVTDGDMSNSGIYGNFGLSKDDSVAPLF